MTATARRPGVRPTRRVVVVSNRVPDLSAGAQAGGLAVALGALMQRRGGLWFGWSGQVSDDTALHRTHADGVDYATIDLTADEHERYYTSFSNSTLWPLLHSMPELMSFDRQNAAIYRAVNAKLATALVPLLSANDLVWVHDYHLMGLPALLRAQGVRVPIGFFLHVPFPTSDMLATVPESEGLVLDLLGADLIGFHTANDRDNFAGAAVALSGATRVTENVLEVDGRRVRLGVFPVEIDAQDFAATAAQAASSPETVRLRESIGSQALILGVDRMDPTKGLPQRLAGYQHLLETRPEWHRRVTFLQIAAQSRAEVAAYRELREAIEQEAGHINSLFSEPDWTPLRLMARAGARDTVAGYMRIARVGLVTPLRDGMNLVAKEFVAAQDPADPGVLILSRFAGAAHQLGAALIVNPHDTAGLADALDRALLMPLAERQQRWQACWQVLQDTSALSWGSRFVAVLLRAATQTDTTGIRGAGAPDVRGTGRPPAFHSL